MKRKSIALSIIIGIGIMYLTGCGNDSASEPMAAVIPDIVSRYGVRLQSRK